MSSSKKVIKLENNFSEKMEEAVLAEILEGEKEDAEPKAEPVPMVESAVIKPIKRGRRHK